ncbi:hypothetical protein ACFL6W_07630 [Thermodesulfobacteriota bacterium]
MIKLNNVVLQEFEKKGFSINEGMAVDARLVKSASRPMVFNIFRGSRLLATA